MTRDAQARARLVESALREAAHWHTISHADAQATRMDARHRAGFRDPSKGSWCAAGLTAAMEDAGLVVPEPGTSARRGAIALLDFVAREGVISCRVHLNEPRLCTQDDVRKAVQVWAEPGDIIAWLQHPLGKDPAGWRRGHVAVIVAVDTESITTVGWNEGEAPGRVMRRRLWRDPARKHGVERVHRRDTVLYRRPGGLYGIARPVAR
jgi:hypothetical protein